MSNNQEAAIAALFQKSFGWGMTIAMVGHTAVLINVDSYGRAEKFYRIRRPRCMSEARRFLRLWQRATG